MIQQHLATDRSANHRTKTLSHESIWHGDFATVKNKLRILILVSERKRGSVPYGPPLACRAHAYGMHSRFCDTVGQVRGLAMMNLSHVEDRPEPQTTRLAEFLHPSHELNMAIVRFVAAPELGGWVQGEAQQGCRSLVPALAVKTVNNTQIHVCWAPLHFCSSRDDVGVGFIADDTSKGRLIR